MKTAESVKRLREALGQAQRYELSHIEESIRTEDLRAVLEALDAAIMSAEEGVDLMTEAHCALAGIAGETLDPCGDHCPGHFQAETMALFNKGLNLYQKMKEEKNESERRD